MIQENLYQFGIKADYQESIIRPSLIAELGWSVQGDPFLLSTVNLSVDFVIPISEKYFNFGLGAGMEYNGFKTMSRDPSGMEPPEYSHQFAPTVSMNMKIFRRVFISLQDFLKSEVEWKVRLGYDFLSLIRS